jgi:hypothetical protein
MVSLAPQHWFHRQVSRGMKCEPHTPKLHSSQLGRFTPTPHPKPDRRSADVQPQCPHIQLPLSSLPPPGPETVARLLRTLMTGQGQS